LIAVPVIDKKAVQLFHKRKLGSNRWLDMILYMPAIPAVFCARRFCRKQAKAAKQQDAKTKPQKSFHFSSPFQKKFYSKFATDRLASPPVIFLEKGFFVKFEKDFCRIAQKKTTVFMRLLR
jgi:hypothetical protein